jgi:DNA-binding MarR family transcriptional regulator
MKTSLAEPIPARAATLAQETRALFGTLKRRLREQGQGMDLTPSQLSVLLRLEHDGPATISMLARAEGMRPQSMGPIIAALTAAELVTSAPDPNDGRQSLLSLTPAYRQWVREGRAARQDWLARQIHEHLAPREQEELARAIALLKRLIED